MQPAQDEQLRGQRERHLEQPLVPSIAGQVLDRLAYLDPVTGSPAEHLVHVGQQRHRRQAVPDRHLDDRSSELPGPIQIRELSARAELDIHHERVESRGELLGQDRADDQRDRLDRCRWRRGSRIAGGRLGPGERSGRRSRSRRAPRGAETVGYPAPRHIPGSTRACRACRRCGRGPRPEIIGTKAPHAATIGASSRLTLSPTPPVECLSRNGPGTAPTEAPIEHVSRARHRARQRHPLAGVHAAPDDRHRQRADLGVGDGAVGDAANQIARSRRAIAQGRRAFAG